MEPIIPNYEKVLSPELYKSSYHSTLQSDRKGLTMVKEEVIGQWCIGTETDIEY
jgi:hypothetical protein